MKKNMGKFIILIILIVGSASSCAFRGVNTASSEPVESVAPKPASSIPVAPSNEQGYTNLPFAKIINPAFADDVANKWVRLNVAFVEIVNTVMDLPPVYQTGYVRLMLADPHNTTNATIDALIPKSKSDPFFGLHPTTTKAGIWYPGIKIWAYLVPEIKDSAVSGRAQKSILIIIEKAKHTGTGAFEIN